MTTYFYTENAVVDSERLRIGDREYLLSDISAARPAERRWQPSEAQQIGEGLKNAAQIILVVGVMLMVAFPSPVWLALLPIAGILALIRKAFPEMPAFKPIMEDCVAVVLPDRAYGDWDFVPVKSAWEAERISQAVRLAKYNRGELWLPPGFLDVTSETAYLAAEAERHRSFSSSMCPDTQRTSR